MGKVHERKKNSDKIKTNWQTLQKFNKYADPDQECQHIVNKKWHGKSPHDENLIKKGKNRTKYQTFLWDKKTSMLP